MKMSDNGEEIFLTANEISKCLRIPLNTIYRLTKRGNIKGVKVGKQWRYDKCDFEKCLKGEIDSRNIHLEKFRERRAYPRMNCNFECKSKVNLQRQELPLSDGYITNISGNGAFLLNTSNLNQISVEDPINVNFDLVSDVDGTAHNVCAKGRIVRKTYNGVGLKFRQIDDKYKNLITRFVD